MHISDSQLKQFQTHGFFFIPAPFGERRMREVDRLQAENYDRWSSTDSPQGFNRLACQFLMLGEPILKLVEQPDVVEMARRLLGCDRVHVGACGLGDAIEGRPQPQVPWHNDTRIDYSKQVSFRTALDHHGPGNAPMRILPGSHRRSRDEVRIELMQLELATGRHEEAPDPKRLFVNHPQELEVVLDPRWTMVWTPNCWHSTGEKTASGPRRAMCWNYYPPDGSKRDLEAIKHLFANEWPNWSEQRKQLWGLA